ncbi:MAG: hypothetical protein WAV15_01905 [Minisyncoccia bacterium]
MPGDADLTKSINSTGDIEKRRRAIILELEKMKVDAKAKGKVFDFNNMWNRLPDSTGISPQYQGAMQLKWQDRVMSEKVSESGESELSTQTTHRKFYEQLDNIISALSLQGKINMEEIHKWVDLFSKGNPTFAQRDEGSKRLQEILEPIYIEMRLLGFSHFDLHR